MSDAAQITLDWATAEVSDAELTVRLSAKPPKSWSAAFTTTAARLGDGTWEVALARKRRAVHVGPVQPGDEERVRLLLEGAVLQANATSASEADATADADGTPADSDPSSRDEQLSERFRAFADEGDTAG